jgi:hypothetical protein
VGDGDAIGGEFVLRTWSALLFDCRGKPNSAKAERTCSGTEQWYDLRVAQRHTRLTLLLAGLLASCGGPGSIARHPSEFRNIEQLIIDVRRASFPQLENAQITVYGLQSDFDYLQARFTVASFFGRKLQYMIYFNREAIHRQVPSDGLRAIVAHELAHINFYESQSRMGLLSLARLLVPSFTTRFERQADLDVIALGYGRGLQSYRTWLYRNIPTSRQVEKKRDYYTPEEIEALLGAVTIHPGVINTFMRCVPRNLVEIEKERNAPATSCPQ